jgi:hypothetical protein
MNDLTAREALALVALAATILAAFANILALEASRARRTLLTVFLLASLILVLYVSRVHLSRQEVAVDQARQELDRALTSERSALAEAQRRIDRERESYDRAVDEALARMRVEFERRLQERASELMEKSQAPNKTYDEARQLVETREGLRRQDIRRFLQGKWQPLTKKEDSFLGWLAEPLSVCDITISGDSIARDLLASYEISDVQGNEVLLKMSAPIDKQALGGTLLRLVPDMKNDRISIANEVCIRKRTDSELASPQYNIRSSVPRRVLTDALTVG